MGTQGRLNTEGRSEEQWSQETGENATVTPLSVLLSLGPTAAGNTQQNELMKANLLAKGPKRKPQKNRKYREYGRKEGAWQSGLALKLVVYKFLGSLLSCAYVDQTQRGTPE